MEHDRRLELIDHAIQKLIHDNKNQVQGSHHNHDAGYQFALSHVISVSQQLETLKGDETLEQCEEASSSSEAEASVVQKIERENEEGVECRGTENEEIIKELKKVKRQNFVTHCLLSVMIVLTVVWQVSEVSLILKVRDGLNHPFRSFGNMLKGMVKVPDVNGSQENDNKEHSLESPTLKIPDTIRVDVPNGGLQNGKE